MLSNAAGPCSLRDNFECVPRDFIWFNAQFNVSFDGLQGRITQDNSNTTNSSVLLSGSTY